MILNMIKKYYGDYSILQIIHSPFNKDKTILHIAANNKVPIKKNIFLRKIILNFDSNGLNPYWDNEALIFYINIIQYMKKMMKLDFI